MTKLLLSLHVLAAILAVGPVTVAASMFPAAVRRLRAEPTARRAAAPALLHRICRVYAMLGVSVPIFGFATASSLGVLGDPWLITSIVLTAVAAATLAFGVLPGQAALLADPAAAPGGPAPAGRPAARLAMLTGVFNLAWATVTVLMVWRPGSTTGA
ncbi:DUF2269 family protein [Micromonospora sp. LZ34]